MYFNELYNLISGKLCLLTEYLTLNGLADHWSEHLVQCQFKTVST